MSFGKKVANTRDECIVCFSKHTDKNPLLNFTSINSIITQCNCNYKCHFECLNIWLNQSSTCLMCNSSVVAIPSILKLNVRDDFRSLSSPLLNNNDTTRAVVQYSPPPPYDSVVSQRDTTETNNLSLSNNNESDISIGGNIIVNIGNDIHPRIKTETPDDDNIPSNFNSEIEEVVDSSSCKCCCVILTVITIGIIIRNII